MTGRTLVVAPHPDDEVLGCGGTLLRRKADGVDLGWIIVTGMSVEAGWSSDRVASRDAEIDRVASVFDFKQVFQLGFLPARLDEVPRGELVAAMSEAISAFAPDELLVPHRGDVHSDHRVCFEVAAACSKSFRAPFIRRVLAYETVSETEQGLVLEQAFRPNVFVDISSFLHEKLAITNLYDSEMGSFPFPRSVKALRALAEWRGASSGFTAAEAFELLRERV
jgi:hypothetical protein